MPYASTQTGDHGHPRAFARAELFVLPTIEKSARPSASLRVHRNVKFSFWNYMSTFVLWTIHNQYSMLCASTQDGDHGHPRAFARVELSVLSTIEKSARPSASLKGRRKVKFSFRKVHVGFCNVDNT